MTVTHPLYGVQNIAQIETVYISIYNIPQPHRAKRVKQNLQLLIVQIQKFCSAIKLASMCMFVLSSFWDTPFL